MRGFITARWRLGLILLAGIIVGWFGKGLASPEGFPALPGSESDPLISRSFAEAMMQFKVLELKTGQRVMGFSGTEMILRSGSATAIGSSLGGLSDVTQGADLSTGQAVPPNHLLIIPRDDGRGMSIAAPSFVMVRGKYEIK